MTRLIDADALKTTNTYALVNSETDENSISFAPMCCVLKEDIDNAPTVEPVIKCPDCKFYRKKWFVDRRMKEKGYWNCWCECHDYWVGGENGFCSLAEMKGGTE